MKLLSLTAVARQLGISNVTARKIAPQFPGAVRTHKRIRYRETAIQEFVPSGAVPGGPGAAPVPTL